MTLTPNLPAPIRRLYLAVGSIAGVAALAAPTLETFERALLGGVCLLLLFGALSGYCCLYALLGLGAKRK